MHAKATTAGECTQNDTPCETHANDPGRAIRTNMTQGTENDIAQNVGQMAQPQGHRQVTCETATTRTLSRVYDAHACDAQAGTDALIAWTRACGCVACAGMRVRASRTHGGHA